jgi:hypothetical protein
MSCWLEGGKGLVKGVVQHLKGKVLVKSRAEVKGMVSVIKGMVLVKGRTVAKG